MKNNAKRKEEEAKNERKRRKLRVDFRKNEIRNKNQETDEMKTV